MAIIEEEVVINYSPSTEEYYRSLGYKPIYKTPFVVKTVHLPVGSHTLVTKCCDICGSVIKNQKYKTIIEHRDKSDGLDRCFGCKKTPPRGKINRKIKFDKSLEFKAKVLTLSFIRDKIITRILTLLVFEPTYL